MFPLDCFGDVWLQGLGKKRGGTPNCHGNYCHKGGETANIYLSMVVLINIYDIGGPCHFRNHGEVVVIVKFFRGGELCLDNGFVDAFSMGPFD